MVFIKQILVFLMVVGSLFGASDMSGRDFKVESQGKLIFLGPGALRLGVYLGLDDRLAGIEAIEKRPKSLAPYREWLQKHQDLEKLPVVSQGGPGVMPSLEALIKSDAKLIIASFMEPSTAKLIEEKTKIPVFLVHYGNGYGGKEEKLSAVKKSLLSLGKVTGKEKRATFILEELNKEENILKNLHFKKHSVYIGGMGYKGAQGIGSTESTYIPFEFLGLKNAITPKKLGHQQVDIETLLRYNPEVIFLDKFGKKIIDKEQKEKKIFFEALKAFKTKQIHWLPPYNYYNTNIENCYSNAWEIAKILEAKEDIEKEKERIMSIFYENK